MCLFSRRFKSDENQVASEEIGEAQLHRSRPMPGQHTSQNASIHRCRRKESIRRLRRNAYPAYPDHSRECTQDSKFEPEFRITDTLRGIFSRGIATLCGHMSKHSATNVVTGAICPTTTGHGGPRRHRSRLFSTAATQASPVTAHISLVETKLACPTPAAVSWRWNLGLEAVASRLDHL